MEQRDTRHLRQGLRMITAYWGRSPSTVRGDASLADDHNSHAGFEARNNTVIGIVAEVPMLGTNLCDGARREEGSDEGEHQESCRS